MLRPPSAQETDHRPFPQILEILGLGSCGPPIPPPTLFSVVSYPVKRLSPATTDIMKHFVFVTPPSDDLSLLDEKKEVEAEAELLTAAITLKVRASSGSLAPGGLQAAGAEVPLHVASRLSLVFSFESPAGNPALSLGSFITCRERNVSEGFSPSSLSRPGGRV